MTHAVRFVAAVVVLSRARRRCRKGQGWEARPMGMKALEKELRELRSMFGQSDGANGGECNLVP